MCGIAGWAGALGVQDGEHRLRLMCDAILHRGPDEAGYDVSARRALGMRRLSIIDVAGGTQPIWNEDGSVLVVFNGEVYNFQELRGELERAGHTFRTRTDTEVLVHLYEEHGSALVHRLRGMFAFALWDERRQRLLLVRDRLGIKPAYYRVLPDGVVFASELKSLHAAGLVDGDLDAGAVAAYMALGYIPDPLSVYRGVHKLPPGHLLTWTMADGAHIERYWTPPAAPDPALDAATAAAEIRRLLEESVRYRLIADVPLGAFLSGGLDSSAVVAEMSRQMDRPVETFSIGFSEPEFNEAPDAAAVARALATNHHELVLTPDVDALIEDVALAFDEPFADSSAIPTLLVSRLAARHVKVVLSGDGGDELFGGYTRYRDFAARPGAATALGRALVPLVRRLPHATPGRNRLLDLGREPVARYVGMVADPLRPDEGGVASASTLAASGGWGALLDPYFAEAAGRDAIGQLLHVDLLSYLPGDILTKVDRMSMAASIEARVPLLDHHLVELACRIPTGLKLRDGTGKWIFREALRERVPAVVFAKRKQGFGVPLRPWFRGPLRPRLDALATGSTPLGDWVDPDAVRRVVDEHVRGRRDRSPLLWKLLMLDIWLRAQRLRPNSVEPVYARA